MAVIIPEMKFASPNTTRTDHLGVQLQLLTSLLFAMYKAIVLFSSALLAAALPTEPAGQCNTGPVQCCNSVQSSSNPATSLLLGLLGVVVQGVNVP
ncbi:hypothetical protein MPER_03760, partial [Moniliophthora perniciosa FA553]